LPVAQVQQQQQQAGTAHEAAQPQLPRPGSLHRPPPMSAVATALTQHWLGAQLPGAGPGATALRPGLSSLIVPQSQPGMVPMAPASVPSPGHLVRPSRLASFACVTSARVTVCPSCAPNCTVC
jgi:hypothetical protein